MLLSIFYYLDKYLNIGSPTGILFSFINNHPKNLIRRVNSYILLTLTILNLNPTTYWIQKKVFQLLKLLGFIGRVHVVETTWASPGAVAGIRQTDFQLSTKTKKYGPKLSLCNAYSRKKNFSDTSFKVHITPYVWKSYYIYQHLLFMFDIKLFYFYS